MTIPERSNDTTWAPTPMQRDALACGAYEVFLGGAAGPGKSEYMVVAPLRWVGHKSFRAVLFRNTFPELKRTLIDKSRRLYPSLGGRYHESDHIWTFPSGAQIEFAYLERDPDVHRYQGAEFQFVGFDELPHFTEYQYRYLQSRLRTAAGIPIRLRATGNPDGPHLEWVRARFAPWIDKQVPAGEVRWFDPEGKMVPSSAPHALSRTYIPGRLRDNPYLGPEYVAQLMALDPVTRAKLLDGDWDAVIGEGSLFHRSWWRYLDTAPHCLRKCRSWDLGAGGDATEGVLWGDRGDRDATGGILVPRWAILDCVSHVGPPHEVHALLKATADMDGPAVDVVIPQDPGQAGKDQAQTYGRELTGFRVISRPVTGDKVVMAGPYSSQVGYRNVGLVRGPWNAAFVAQHHAFPDPKQHDDKIDAAATGFAHLAPPEYFSQMAAAMNKLGRPGARRPGVSP